MNSLTKQYIKNVKALFPILGKDERNYLYKLQSNIEINNDELSTLEDFYKQFGYPEEVVNLYYTNTDIDYVISQIKKYKNLKRIMIVFVIGIIILLLIYNIHIYQVHQTLMDGFITDYETVIY